VRDYYATVAQVLPVLLLALMSDSGYLERLPPRPRRLRRNEPVGGVRFWTKPRVRAYALFLMSTVVVDTALCVLMLPAEFRTARRCGSWWRHFRLSGPRTLTRNWVGFGRVDRRNANSSAGHALASGPPSAGTAAPQQRGTAAHDVEGVS
jgi:hypothetical protein